MLINRILTLLTIAGALLLVPSSLSAQSLRGILMNATSIDCTFSVMSLARWNDEGQPEAEITEVDSELRFDAVNADEGTAELAVGLSAGVYDIIVRYAEGYLSFIQSFRDGRLYSTTVMEAETIPGRLRAMHSRHEYSEYALIGFTNSPEQYYGDCEILESGDPGPPEIPLL